MEGLTYEQARDIIQDGDIVFLHGTHKSWVQNIIMAFTASTYTHVCIAFWITLGGEERLMCVEAQSNTARRILSMSFYEDRKFTVLASPNDWSMVREDVLARVGKVHYSITSAIYVGIREWLLRTCNISLPSLQLSNEICSEFVATVVGLEDVDISPQCLYEQLSTITYERN